MNTFRLPDWLQLCDESRWHPAAGLFPLLHDEELNRLAEDIWRSGLQHPVVLNDGMVLDGRNRLLACGMAGVEPVFAKYDGCDPWAYVLGMNLARRHMTKSMLACGAVLWLEDPASAAIVAATPGREAEQAAERFNVSPRYVYYAMKLRAQDSLLFEEVRSGLKVLQQAQSILKDPEKELEPPPELETESTNPVLNLILSCNWLGIC